MIPSSGSRGRAAGTKALLIGNGSAPRRAFLPAWVFGDVGLVVAADGGAATCQGLGLRPDLVVGDLDSADPALIDRLARSGVEVRVFPSEKDESDLELAMRAAIAGGADRLVALGALGGPRLEHTVAAVALLDLAAEQGVEMALVDERSTLRLLDAGSPLAANELEIEGAPGDYVSLFACGQAVQGVVTEGLRYPLHGEALVPGPSRGLSNELISAHAAVRCGAGRLLVVHTRRSAVDSVGPDPAEE